jgi:hypothetical protein
MSRKKIICIIILAIAAVFASGVLALPTPPQPERITYGVTFSKKISTQLNVDWKETYLAILNELKPANVRLGTYWPEIEGRQGIYDFTDIDWLVAQAKNRNIGVVLAVGQKLPRWPECQYPEWMGERIKDQTKPLNDTEQNALLNYVSAVVEHFKNEPAVKYWQLENEPFLPFGICPPLNTPLLDKEVALLRSLDNTRRVIMTESGEFSTWLGAASRADIVGTSLYRIVWNKYFNYYHYPIPEWFYWKKVTLVKLLYPKVNDVVIIELQAEPWAHLQIYENTVDEMMKSMNPDQFVENFRYAKASRFATQYAWGAEWWYWMKTKQNNPFYWDAAKKIFEGTFEFPK